MRHDFRTALVAIAAVLTATPASALRMHLDADVDGDPATFRNDVFAFTVPVDLIVEVEEGDGDVSLPFGVVQVSWDYSDPGGGPTCFDTVGSVDFRVSIPDNPPYVDIFADSCVCRSPARCVCESFFHLAADTDGPVAPGFYRVATLDFSRIGLQCGAPFIYPSAEFELSCSICSVPSGEPTQKMVVRNDPISVEGSSWGGTKARYR